MSLPDRLQRLVAPDQTAFTGLDFIYVYETQNILDVYFLKEPDTVDTSLVNDILIDQLEIMPQRDVPNTVSVDSIVWDVVDSRHVLRVNVSGTKEFVPYRLRLDDSRIDPYFRQIIFSFQAACPSDLDCEPDDALPMPFEWVDFPVNYQARDFLSFRKVLTDFASERYPHWFDRLEADLGIMLLEVMSALGDEFSYYQDRIAQEASLETATQRRSLKALASLVDYNVHEGLEATTWLDFEVTAGMSGNIPAGFAVETEDGDVHFEVGAGVADTSLYEVDSARNAFTPHIWDEDDTKLPKGSQSITIEGHHGAVLPLDDGGDPAGRWLLLHTDPVDPAQRSQRIPVRVTQVTESTDPLADNPNITMLSWELEHALLVDLDLTEISVRGNILPATAGRTYSALFATDSSSPTELPLTIERVGADNTTIHCYSIPATDEQKLAWLGGDPNQGIPDVLLEEVEFDGVDYVPIAGRTWEWRRSLLGIAPSLPDDRHFTLESGTWKRVVGYWRNGAEFVHRDYADNAGQTIRFGGGEFGMIPVAGTIFRVSYRLGVGQEGNIARDVLIHFENPGFLDRVTNSTEGVGGMDAETFDKVRQNAPEAFRAVTYRAVRPEDYAEAVERLDWVQRAGATTRWTGSWLTTFVTADPIGAVALSDEYQQDMLDMLNRFRQAGRDVAPQEPRYVNLDIEVTVCAKVSAYRGDVKENVMDALSPPAGFFAPDNFTFGTSLTRSKLESRIQTVSGVQAVERIRIKRRGWFDWRDMTEFRFMVAQNEVIRIANDVAYPEQGAIKVIVTGGA